MNGKPIIAALLAAACWEVEPTCEDNLTCIPLDAALPEGPRDAGPDGTSATGTGGTISTSGMVITGDAGEPNGTAGTETGGSSGAGGDGGMGA
jgi:hypothetical protein